METPATDKTPAVAESVLRAQKERTLVKGNVVSAEKNGFVVTIDGETKAFCPLQKMADGFIHIKNSFVGKEMTFVVEQIKAGVPQLSRLAAIKIENAKLLDHMAENWRSLNPELSGTVLRTTGFGAFIDVGGLEGLIPISELSWGHTENTDDVVKPGDKVNVKIIRWEKKEGRHKVSFSRKALLANPWESLESDVRPGARLTGKITRKADQGVFVQIKEDIEGLLSPEEFGWDSQAAEASADWQVGTELEVLIMRIDSRRRQMQLSRKFPEADPWKDVEERLTGKESHQATVLSLNSAGATVQIEEGIEGFLPVRLLQKAFESAYRKKTSPGQVIDVTVKKIDRRSRSLVLSLPQLATGDEDQDNFREYQRERAKTKDTSAEGGKLGSLGAMLQARMAEKK